ncbi:MAG: DNA polymerase [Phycisphaeraceae bacterium]
MPKLIARQPGEDLAAELFDGQAVTPTGRIRGRLSSPQACNTPFQGLAADGAKLALFELIRRGYRVVGYVHDEVIVEVPTEQATEAEVAISDILKGEMRRVLGTDIPVQVDSMISERWGKP